MEAGIRRAHTSLYLLGTGLFPGPLHSKIGCLDQSAKMEAHTSGQSRSLGSATSLDQGWLQGRGCAGRVVQLSWRLNRVLPGPPSTSAPRHPFSVPQTGGRAQEAGT